MYLFEAQVQNCLKTASKPQHHGENRLGELREDLPNIKVQTNHERHQRPRAQPETRLGVEIAEKHIKY
jgi:hypothetical protein